MLGKQTSSLTASPNTRLSLCLRMGFALFSTGYKVGAGADSSAASCFCVPTYDSKVLANLARQHASKSARRSARAHGPNIHGACGGTTGYSVSATTRAHVSTMMVSFPSLHPCNCIIACKRILHRNTVDLCASVGSCVLRTSAAQSSTTLFLCI